MTYGIEYEKDGKIEQQPICGDWIPRETVSVLITTFMDAEHLNKKENKIHIITID